MVKIFEKQHQLTNITNYQSRVIKYNSFEEYLESLEVEYSPNDELEVCRKHIDQANKIVTFILERKINGQWIEFIHFAQVITE